MRVLLISRGDVFPPFHGAASRIVNTAKYLSRESVEVIFLPSQSDRYYLFRNGEAEEIQFSPFLRDIKSNTDKIDIILNRMEIPREDHILYRPLLARDIILRAAALSFNNDFDIIQAEFPAFSIPAFFAKKVRFGRKIRQVLVEHNVEFERIGISSPAISKKGIKSLRRIEKFACRISDKIVTVSEDDKNKLIGIGVEREKITVIPHGVDLGNYVNVRGEEIREKLGIPADAVVLFFHGVYDYKPNRDALFRIVNSIFTVLRQKGVNAVVLAAGQNPPQELKREGVYLTGAVENLPDFIDAADICLVPLTGGGGTRLKILEYFAAKKPVLSTAKGIEGINVKDGTEYIKAEKDEDFVKYIAQYQGAKDKFLDIGENGFRFVQQYDWSNIARQYLRMYQGLISA
ncbi:MAG: glycosyltransferase family 4 protein [Deltaproteobacteria bacterium]|nr:glycosyltransferase family 4 protein [Deltaproteobacteria bacterium]